MISNMNTIKFLYSYGGKILPRRTDGKLRYVGGMTRILSVDRNISFAELMVKFGELCGSSVTLKCKLPNEDLDVLISMTSSEDLKNLIDEYDRFSQDAKIRAVLFPVKSLKKITPVSSAEDLCSAGSVIQSDRAMWRPPIARGVPYLGRYNNGCRGGVIRGKGNTCFLATTNYCR